MPPEQEDTSTIKNMRLFIPITEPLDIAPMLETSKSGSVVDSVSLEAEEQGDTPLTSNDWHGLLSVITPLPQLNEPMFSIAYKPGARIVDKENDTPISPVENTIEKIEKWLVKFRSALLYESSESIRCIWYDAPDLAREYFLGMSIKAADMDKAVSISKEEWIENLRAALFSCTTDFTTRLCVHRPELFRDFLSGDFDLKIEQHRDNWCLNFQSLLYSQQDDLIQYILFNYPILVNYFLGDTILVGTADASETVSLSFSQWKVNFWAILKSANTSLIERALALHPKRVMWFCGEVMNSSDDAQAEILHVEQWCKNFKFAIVSKHVGILNEMINRRPDMAYYFCGRPINLGSEHCPDTQQIDMNQWFNHLALALYCKCEEVIKQLYEARPLLAEIFHGEIVNCGSMVDPKIVCLDVNSWDYMFKQALVSQDITIINKMCATRAPSTFNHFFGDTLIDSDGVADKITVDTWVLNFRAALRSKHAEFIAKMWNHNLQLRRYFSGSSTKFMNGGEEKCQQIDLAEWLTNFHCAVKAEQLDIASMVWDGGKAAFFAELVALEPEGRALAIGCFLFVEERGTTIESLLKPIEQVCDLNLLKSNLLYKIDNKNSFIEKLIGGINEKILQQQQLRPMLANKSPRLANSLFSVENRKRKQRESVEPIPSNAQRRRIYGKGSY